LNLPINDLFFIVRWLFGCPTNGTGLFVASNQISIGIFGVEGLVCQKEKELGEQNNR
jgi:hypothetical protein